jgi:hypothetical protein
MNIQERSADWIHMDQVRENCRVVLKKMRSCFEKKLRSFFEKGNEILNSINWVDIFY